MRVGSSVLVVLALVSGAHAEPSVADQTFARGRELMREKKFAEACAAFEQSQRLDPQFGTLFNLAGCEVELGKLASAFHHYRELAKSDSNTARRARSADLAAQLAPSVPKLVVAVPGRPSGFALAIDGADSTSLVGVEVPVDLGTHAIVATAPGFRERRETVGVARGQIAKLVVRLDRVDAPVTPVVELHAAVPPDAGERVEPSRRGDYGKLAVIGGGAIVAGGLVFGGLAWAKWSDARSCTSCDRASESHSAGVLGDVSTVLVVVGLVPVAAGLYLWHTSSSSATLAPQATSDGGGLSIVGRF